MANEFKIKNGFFSEGSSNVTGSLNVSAGITGSLLGTASFATTTISSSFALTASNITPAISNDADTRVVTANGNGTLNGEGNLTFNGQTLSVLYGVGDEGGEMLLGKPATNTTLTGSGVTVDVFQNRLRFFEQGGTARGFYLDITTGGSGASTNLASGGGTVTSVGTTGTVNGITLTGGPITGAGTITLGGTLSGITPSQLATSSIRIGSTDIALGATASSLTGLTSINSTSFTGSLLGTSSWARNAVTASTVISAGQFGGGNQYLLVSATQPGNNAVSPFLSTLVYDSTTNTLPTTASWATNAVTASYATQALSASYATQALSSSYALTTSNSQNAQDILIYVKNVTGAQINKGKVVRISGAPGDNALIAPASYESDGVSANTLGITSQDIPNDSFGYVITEGTLIGINTNAFSAGQLLYLGATGSIIGTAPVAPLHAVRLGQVLRVQAINGSMYVRIDNGYELGELHDVVDTTTTSSYGDLLVKSGSVWGNSKQLTGSYGLTGSLNATSFTGSLLGTSSYATQALSASFASSTAAVAGTINYVPKFATATTLGNSVIYDNGTDVGIGTTSPSSKLHLQDTTTLLTLTDTTYNRTSEIGYLDSANLYLANDNASNTYIGRYNNLFLAYGGGNVGINTTTPNSKLQVVGNTSISGSLITSGSTGDGINTSTLELLASGVTSIDWGNKELYDTNN